MPVTRWKPASTGAGTTEKRGENEMYEVAWREINRKGEFVVKRKSFASAKARERFIEKLMEKDSFDCLFGVRDPEND